MKKNYIALGGLFASAHVLFLLLTKFVVGSELLLVLFLPLLSTVYTLKSDKKSVIMFVIATLLVCFIFDFISTFVYIVPSLICGVVYGVLRRKKCKELELLCISGLTHMLSIMFSFLVIVFLFKEVDFMGIFEKLFSLTGEYVIVVSLLTLFVLGFCEAFLVHIVTDSELSRFVSKVEKNECVPKWFAISSGVSFGTFIILYFIANVYSVFPMLMFFVFFIPYIVEGVINLKYKVLTFTLIVVFSIASLFVINYIDPLCYLMLPVFSLSPFVVNNFVDNKEKTFKTGVNEIK
jgi:hypothetical protein